MKKWFILSLLFLMFSYCSSPESPVDKTKLPEVKKPALIKLNIQNLPVYINYDYWTKMYTSTFTLIISEHNGVDCNITLVKVEGFMNDVLKVSNTEPGGYLRGYGTLSISCYLSSSWNWNKTKITVTGKDINGYDQQESITLQ